MKISKIVEKETAILYMRERNLLKQYKKSKQYLLSGFFNLVNFKKRKPIKDQIWYFRINKQFRALCHFRDDILIN